MEGERHCEDANDSQGKKVGEIHKLNQGKSKPKFDDPIMDPDWLYQTLRKEINKEATYNLENDAKIRAVTEGTVDYEQFRQRVLGAHIRPLQKADKVEGCQNGRRPYVVWNTVARKDKTEDEKYERSKSSPDES